jgi:hypothetical protein
MFITSKGEKINTDNPKMIYDTYSDKGWWTGSVEYVSLYEYLDKNPPTMEISKRIYNEARRHGVQVKKYIHPDTNLKQFSANRYPRPWLDMIFDVIIFELGDTEGLSATPKISS